MMLHILDYKNIHKLGKCFVSYILVYILMDYQMYMYTKNKQNFLSDISLVWRSC